VVNLDRFVDQFAPRLFFFSSYFEPVANGHEDGEIMGFEIRPRSRPLYHPQ
jgi:hypothetical protein